MLDANGSPPSRHVPSHMLWRAVTCQRDDASMFDPLSAQDRTLRLAKDVNDFPFKDTLINEPGARCRRRLSVGCSTILSKAIWTAQQCAGDIHQFCPTATFGSVGDCMRPHLGEVSGTCKAAMAFMASPAADRY
jgi:hypothetical protein